MDFITIAIETKPLLVSYYTNWSRIHSLSIPTQTYIRGVKAHAISFCMVTSKVINGVISGTSHKMYHKQPSVRRLLPSYRFSMHMFSITHLYENYSLKPPTVPYPRVFLLSNTYIWSVLLFTFSSLISRTCVVL